MTPVHRAAVAGCHRLVATIRAPRRRRAWLSMAGLVVSLLLLGGFIALHNTGSAESRPSSVTARPTVDPRLVLRRHAEPFSGTIDGGLMLSGTLSPSLPGVNTIHLTIGRAGQHPARGSRVTLVLTMPGMVMAPVRATLAARAHGYSGSVVLPMFGTYRAQVDAIFHGGRYRGSLTMRLPLALATADYTP